jgi:hypothetical protein
MLDVRPNIAGAVGFPYSCLDVVQFIPPEALRLIFADCEVSTALRARHFAPAKSKWYKGGSSGIATWVGADWVNAFNA